MTLISRALWNLNVTCPCLSQVPLVKQRRKAEGRSTDSRPGTQAVTIQHPGDMPLLTMRGTEGASQTYTTNAQVSKLVQRTLLPTPYKVKIFLDEAYRHLVSLNTTPIYCAVQYVQEWITHSASKGVFGHLLSTQSSTDPTSPWPLLQGTLACSPIYWRWQKTHASFPN